MPLVTISTLLSVADRCAYQYGKVAAAFDNISPTGSGSWGTGATYYWEKVTSTDDPDVEIPTLSPYYTVDTTGMNLAQTVRSGMSSLGTIVTAMDAHFARMNYTGSWDGMLTTNNERVSDHFNQVYYLFKGSYMLANNVFPESAKTFGEWDYGDIFTVGTSFGNGAVTNKANGTYFAATQLKIVVGPTSTSITDLTMVITGMQLGNPSPVTITAANISAGSPGDEFDVGTTSDRFLSVTNLQADPVHAGSSGNVVLIKNIKERQVEP